MSNAIDQLNFASSKSAQRVAFKALNAVQDENAGLQLAGAAMFLLLLCERHKLQPNDVLNKAARITYDAFSEGRSEQARAIRDYLQGEHK